MERSFEAVLVEQCAPTLAGLKPASLFRYQAADGQRTLAAAVHWARQLAPYGLTVQILKVCPRTGACLIYLYRAGWLRSILAEPSARAFLAERGYETDRGCLRMLAQLSERLCLEAEFPHEIGVFLGYPLDDVKGFILHRGRNYTYCGCWKCYGDPQAAKRRFARYRRCTEAFRRRYAAGTPIIQLVVAA